MTHINIGEACGSDCMRDNGCHGYEECADCGHRFCRFDLDDRDLCPRCAERRDEYADEADDPKITCQWCGRKWGENETFCPQCGEKREAYENDNNEEE